ncbi:MAG: WG repeat-containing protein [Candidatus Aminicenantales bacterium]
MANRQGKWGFIDTKGNVVIPFQYDLADCFINGLVCVHVRNHIGYIDRRCRCVWELGKTT